MNFKKFDLLCAFVIQLFMNINAIPTNDDKYGELVYTSVIFRHGDRTPTQFYPNDPYNESNWPEGVGQLTNVGKKQEYDLGGWLKEHYSNLLPSQYHKDKLFVNSSDMDRTLMSAECLLAGLFPPRTSELWLENLKWQPIPIHSLPNYMDNVLALKKPCVKYDFEENKLNVNADVREFYSQHEDVCDYTLKNSGDEMPATIVDVIRRVSEIYDTLLIENNNNMTLPTWTHTVFPERLKTIADYNFLISTFTKEMKKLQGGPLLKILLDTMAEKRSGNWWLSDRVITLYSAHDSTVAALLNALGAFNMVCPPYSATVLVELRRLQRQYIVVISYKNSTEEPHVLEIPGCKHPCSLDRLIQVTKDVIPIDWDKECEMTWVPPANTFSQFLLFLFIVCFILFWLMLSVRLGITRRTRYGYYENVRHSLVKQDMTPV